MAIAISSFHADLHQVQELHINVISGKCLDWLVVR